MISGIWKGCVILTYNVALSFWQACQVKCTRPSALTYKKSERVPILFSRFEASGVNTSCVNTYLG